MDSIPIRHDVVIFIGNGHMCQVFMSGWNSEDGRKCLAIGGNYVEKQIKAFK